MNKLKKTLALLLSLVMVLGLLPAMALADDAEAPDLSNRTAIAVTADESSEAHGQIRYDRGTAPSGEESVWSSSGPIPYGKKTIYSLVIGFSGLQTTDVVEIEVNTSESISISDFSFPDQSLINNNNEDIIRLRDQAVTIISDETVQTIYYDLALWNAAQTIKVGENAGREILEDTDNPPRNQC